MSYVIESGLSNTNQIKMFGSREREPPGRVWHKYPDTTVGSMFEMAA